MGFNFNFQSQILDCVVGGVSTLDIPQLNVHNMEQAKQFLLAYGYDLDDDLHREQLWSTHRRAVALIKEQLLNEGESIPEELYEPQKLTNIGQLLIYASSRKKSDLPLQRWACAILRVMHVYEHLRHDLFSAFSDEIQLQILKPLQDAIITDPATGSITLGQASEFNGIKLYKVDIKPFKTTGSSVIKLLARPEKVALTLLDKLGVRFVTRSVFDSFRVIRFLFEQNIVSFPHIIPDQSNNTLFPLNIFLEVMEESKTAQSEGQFIEQEKIQVLLDKKFTLMKDQAEYLEKFNEFSGHAYKMIKFINRKLITVAVGPSETQRHFRFFYPYEIQIMDYHTYVTNLSGPMAHDEYKNRQRQAARARVLGVGRAE